MAETAENNAQKAPLTMETLVAYCHRKGYIFQASEIYGGLNGFFDYGPLGVELKNNIKASWWRTFVHDRDDMVGLDSAIIQNRSCGWRPGMWEASTTHGGLQGARSATVRTICYGGRLCRWRDYRTCQLITDERDQERADEMAEKMKRKQGKQGTLAPVVLKPFTQATKDEIPLIPSPATGKPGTLTEARQFNMMFKTYVGALEGASSRRICAPRLAENLYELQKHPRHRARQSALWHRADWKGVPQRNYPAQLHLPLARVRTDGD
jgi:glycyl-tRNA synthetase